MDNLKKILDYFKNEDLILATAESCTAGKIINLLARLHDSSKYLDVGFVVYSISAKSNILKVKKQTIDKYNLTSPQVAEEMALGASKKTKANVIIATTGIAGPEPIDNIPPGTICFAWAFKDKKQLKIFTETKKFNGTKTQVLDKAAKYALMQIPKLHKRFKKNS